MTQNVGINVDMTAVNNEMNALKTALFSFSREWAQAYPDQIDNGIKFLDDLAERHGIPSSRFDDVKKALRGELEPKQPS